MSTISPETPDLRLPDLRRYLLNAGWFLVDGDERTSLWMPRRGPQVTDDGAFVRLVLPADEGFTDYREQVDAALRALSFVERRMPREIVDDITLGGADNVSIRLTPDTPSGEAPLDLAHSAITALRNYVVGSASSLEVKALVLPSRRPIRAEAYARDTRFSTAEGSFVMNLALPLGEAGQPSAVETGDEPLFTVSEVPYGRRVTNRMAQVVRGAVRLAEQVGAGDEPISSFGRADGLSANATELSALASIGALADERLRYRVRFAQTRLTPTVQLPDPLVVTVTPSNQTVFAEAADFLRTKQPRSGVNVSGLVVRLARTGTLGPGDIVVEGVDDDTGSARRFRVNLAEADYERAIRAHRLGFEVLVSGDLEIRGNQRHLTNLASFHVSETLGYL